ncbi:hypothetical protein G5B40_20545 [Pikeienuella piscinae]|uniref:Uncharacterized protein n=1 Tax=Pikeienuella piscinae TaxID=2748098 RepID=A0A7M3T6K0_9RHOB|nr:hypothetical protein [Pikeienuella piscinae]QIE57631.1 hypothetical protein G5B40_20545 [Pikeienuella piscinae]
MLHVRFALLVIAFGLAACEAGITTSGASDARALVGDGGGNGAGAQ